MTGEQLRRRHALSRGREGAAMIKPIQVTVDEALFKEVDSASVELGMSRTAFIQEALRQALDRLRMAEQEQRHAAGYARRPVEPGEFDMRETEQV